MMASATTTTRAAIRGVTHMISAGHSLAAAAGYRILEQGGNAIDAGVASGIVINTVLPENTSFGGVAPIMIYDAASDSVVTISGLDDLVARGHDVHVRDDWEPMSMAALSAIVIDAESGVLTGGADPRRDAHAIGR